MNGEIITPKFGDIFYAELTAEGHVQGGMRPVIVVQNDDGNKYSPVTNVIPMTSRTGKALHLPTHVYIEANRYNGLSRDSVALVEQTRPINKIQLKNKIGSVEHRVLVELGRATKIQFPFPVA